MFDGAAGAAGADSIHVDVHSAAPRAAHRLHRGFFLLVRSIRRRRRPISSESTRRRSPNTRSTRIRSRCSSISTSTKFFSLFPSFPAHLPSFRGYPTPPHPAKRPAHLSETPPLSSRGFSPDSIDSVLWADRPDSKVATSCLFSLHLGPGPLGAYLQPERRQLVYVPVGTPAVIEDVVVLNSAKSRELKGWIGSYLDKCPLLQADPVILEINGTHAGTR